MITPPLPNPTKRGHMIITGLPSHKADNTYRSLASFGRDRFLCSGIFSWVPQSLPQIKQVESQHSAQTPGKDPNVCITIAHAINILFFLYVVLLIWTFWFSISKVSLCLVNTHKSSNVFCTCLRRLDVQCTTLGYWARHQLFPFCNNSNNQHLEMNKVWLSQSQTRSPLNTSPIYNRFIA